MRDSILDTMLKGLFKSDKKDWTDKEAWMRRAMLWKFIAIALVKDNTTPFINSLYDTVTQADQISAPSEKQLKQLLLQLHHYTVKKQDTQNMEEETNETL